ncbi:MAG: DUF2520 domain-containing protein [Acidimicrobiia bacterium]|nr:DUF2520 domain-containing protein [Acidimicrobiia bacterium]MDH3462711.1 DUF2520 domain-containing protein [Acidimicrobiia bacterium]
MRLIIVGPGRAGGSLALASARAGHEIAAVLGDSDRHYGTAIQPGEEFPEADVALVCVRDDQIEEVVEEIRDLVSSVTVVAHVSGFVPITVLNPLASTGVSVGGFHPLQTLPDPERGASSLAGSHVGIDGDLLAVDALTHLALALEMSPFRLSDEVRPLYHAAAAAASNFVVTALATAADLFDAAAIDPKVSRPLVDRVVSNVFDSGARKSLTGPIARGDTETVVGHLVAAHQVSHAVGRQYRLLAEATAIIADQEDEVGKWR